VDCVSQNFRVAVAWAMTVVIQRAEHRDTQALHAKLDEILHALGDARNEITRMDEEGPRKSSDFGGTCARTTSPFTTDVAGVFTYARELASARELAKPPDGFPPR
jgi:low affinity Fe/Cu permease